MGHDGSAATLAPLRPDLDADRRRLAELLRPLFHQLDVSVRRYAARHHIDAGAVSRYLNGTRNPPWPFITELLAELRERGTPVTDHVEETLRDLHRRARRSNSAASEVERLRAQLAEADETARNAELNRGLLADAVRDAKRDLDSLQRRLRQLDRERESAVRTHHEALVRWTDSYQRLQQERDELRERVARLREALHAARAEVFEAEQRCAGLERDLEGAEQRSASGADQSLVELLESTDRTASVSELVALVGHLNTPARTVMATEVVKSAACTRPVREGAALVEALYAAGQRRYAEAALPAMVAGRPALDAAELVAAFAEAGLDEPAAVVLTSSVHLHPPEALGAVASLLHHLGHREHALAALGGAVTTWELPDVAALCEKLPDGEHRLVADALTVCGQQRHPGDVAALVTHFEQFARPGFAAALLAAAVGRPAQQTAEVAAELHRRGGREQAERLLLLAAGAGESPRQLADLVFALHRAALPDLAAVLLRRTARDRDPADTGAMVAQLHGAGGGQYAVLALTECVRSRSAADFHTVIRVLDAEAHGGLLDVLGDTTAVVSAGDLATVVRQVEVAGFAELASGLLWRIVRGRSLGHARGFVTALAQRGAHVVTPEGLRRYAALAPSGIALLVRVLEEARLPDGAHSLLAAARSGARPAELAALLLELRRGLPERSAELWAHTQLTCLARELDGDTRVELLFALESVALRTTDYPEYFEHAVRQLGTVDHRPFKRAVDEARKSRRKEHDRDAVLSLKNERRHRRQARAERLSRLVGRR